MRGTVRRFSGVVLGLALVTGLTAGPVSAESGRDALQRAMDGLVEAGAAGVQIRVHDDRGGWNGTAGVRKLGSDDPVPTNGRFRAASITKIFVATVLLQLVDETELTLDDPVADYLPQHGLDPRITVRMLLQHTSGLFDYIGDINPDGTFEPGIPLSGQEFVRNRFHRYRPTDLVEVALAKPARFEPGTSWSYSNTNYVLAGLLIERLTGTPYAHQVQRRILAPLGLRQTVLPGTALHIPGPHAHGYYAYPHDGEVRVVDVSVVSATWLGSAGEIISTPRDLDRFLSALFHGQLLSAGLLAQMRDVLPVNEGYGYGLGLEQLTVPPQCGGNYQGHTGGTHGYQSYLFSNQTGNRRITLSVTLGTQDLEEPDAAQRFSLALRTVLLTAACGTTPPASTARHMPTMTVR